MATLREFAQKNQEARAGLPAAVQIGKTTRRGIGLGWILEDPGLADCIIHAFAKGSRATAIGVKEAAS